MARALVKDVLTGFEFPQPSTYEGTTSTLVDSGRNTNGEVIASVIVSDLAKVSLSWRYLTGSQWSSILKLFEPKQGGSFSRRIEFLDQVTNTWVTRDLYVSDRTSGMYHIDANDSVGYTNCAMSLIDMGKR